MWPEQNCDATSSGTCHIRCNQEAKQSLENDRKQIHRRALNKVQGYLNEIGAFKNESNEDNKVFIDRFRKLVDDVRSIDETQVPTDLNLMAVLKKAMLDDVVLWGNLEFNSDNMSLSRMMDIISKWKPKDSKKSSAVANYSALPGNLKKAHAKKQNSGRGSGKDKIGRAVVETRACLACKKVGPLVRDCRNKEAKDAWLAKREKKNDRRDNDDEPRGRKHDRHPRERSDSRGSSRERSRSQERDSGRSSSRERSNGRDRPNDRDFSKKKKFTKSSKSWMSSDGEDLSDGDDSGERNMLWWEEEVEGERVGLAFQAAAAPELVCVDSGCNRLILVDATGVDDYAEVLNSFLRTAQATARLQIAGRGRIGTIAVKIIPGATANLMSTD